MRITEKMEKMIDVLQTNADALQNYNGSYNHYFAPHIPEKIIKKLIKYYDTHLPINSIIAYFDTTLFNSCKGGYIFTNNGFYHKGLGKVLYFNYKDISYMEMSDSNLRFSFTGSDMTEYMMIGVFDLSILKKIIQKLIDIDNVYGQSSNKTTGKVKKIDIPEDMMKKCNIAIHSASTAAGAVGTGLAQIPASDNAVIVPIQIAMIVSLGTIFDLNITEAAAKSYLVSMGATFAGRTASQFLVGWMPGIGNAINTATAAGVTEAIGWMVVKNFYERWLEDKDKGRYEGMKDGYNEASAEYEKKLKSQAEEFIKQKKDVEKEREEYEKLLEEYEKYIKELEEKCESADILKEMKALYNNLKQLQSE